MEDRVSEPKRNGHNGHRNGNGHDTGEEGIRLKGGSIREAFAGKHLLVTGVTGFLGKVWLAMVLDYLPEVGRATVIIRPKKGEDANARFQRIAERSPAFRPLREKLGAKAFRTLIREKIRVVEAKLVEPLCGLEEAEADSLLADVDVVVHFAGLTDFEPDPQMAIDANVHGAQHAADLAARTRGKRYVHVSTTFVAGRRSETIGETIEVGVSPNGTEFDPAEELQLLEAGIAEGETKKQRTGFAMERANALGWPNIYTYSKGLSEHLIETREDVATTTFRPAIVECARSYPFEGWNEGINTSGPLVWLLSTTFQRFPARTTNIFDIVPVDTVARSMVVVVAEALRDRAEPIYQCGSSAINPLDFRRAVDLTGLAIRRMYARRGDDFEKKVLAKLDPICMEPTDDEVFGHRRMRLVARATRNFLRKFKLKENVSPKLYDKIDGEKVDEKLRKFSMDCRTTDRKLGQVEDMLRVYLPFVNEIAYVFRTDNLVAATERMSDADRELFGFDVADICWRNYWVNVQVPGLDKWSLPLLRNEKVPDDPPLEATEGDAETEDNESAPLRATA
jgi:thioester reductase-like protein